MAQIKKEVKKDDRYAKELKDSTVRGILNNNVP
jgi:hypothetical protein